MIRRPRSTGRVSRLKTGGTPLQCPSAREAHAGATPLPPGVLLVALQAHRDSRGDFTEIYRTSWQLAGSPVQWNLIRSRRGSLRGIHAHQRHIDTLFVVSGEAIIGLQDLRSGRPEEGVAAMVKLRFDDPFVMLIPAGVAHGFCFAEPGCIMNGVSEEFDGTDEFGCHWADPELRMTWPIAKPDLSVKDQSAGTLRQLIRSLER